MLEQDHEEKLSPKLRRAFLMNVLPSWMQGKVMEHLDRLNTYDEVRERWSLSATRAVVTSRTATNWRIQSGRTSMRRSGMKKNPISKLSMVRATTAVAQDITPVTVPLLLNPGPLGFYPEVRVMAGEKLGAKATGATGAKCEKGKVIVINLLDGARSARQTNTQRRDVGNSTPNLKG